jgi:hypothetical protein
MPYIVAVLPHDFLGKMELMRQCQTEEEARLVAAGKNPFARDVKISEEVLAAFGDPDEDDDDEHHYSAIIWESTIDEAYEGNLGKPLAIYYRGVPWTAES